MEVVVARHAGFCMGVDMALKKLDQAIAESINEVVATIGPIIHNPQVLQEYKEKNVQILQDIDEVKQGMSVLIRAHGIPQKDEKIVRSIDAKFIDATCPKVKSAQISVAKATEKAKADSILLLYGEEDHPEVKGLVSYSAIPYHIFSNPEEIYTCLSRFPENFIVAAQTTQDKEIYKEFTKKLKNLAFGSVEILNTICNATSERQEAVRELVGKVDVFIVVGGKTSGNTRRLAEIAASYNLPTHHIETVQELNLQDFSQNTRFGLSAGASTPRKYIDEVKNAIQAYKRS